jgi:hypothetical protein
MFQTTPLMITTRRRATMTEPNIKSIEPSFLMLGPFSFNRRSLALACWGLNRSEDQTLASHDFPTAFGAEIFQHELAMPAE